MGRRACLIALVPTATILASDFAAQGIRVMDIAHLNIKYECFFKGQKIILLLRENSQMRCKMGIM